MQFWTYLRAVLTRTFRGFVPVIDAMQVIMASAVPLFFYARGIKMPDDTVTAVLSYIGIAAVTYGGLRFLSAPFFIWRDQQQEISRLRSELSRPQREARSAADAKLRDRQHLFWDQASALVSHLRQRRPGPHDWNNSTDQRISSAIEAVLPTLESLRVHSASHSVAQDIVQQCKIIWAKGLQFEDRRVEQKQLHQAMERFSELMTGSATPPSASPSDTRSPSGT